MRFLPNKHEILRRHLLLRLTTTSGVSKSSHLQIHNFSFVIQSGICYWDTGQERRDYLPKEEWEVFYS